MLKHPLQYSSCHCSVRLYQIFSVMVSSYLTSLHEQDATPDQFLSTVWIQSFRSPTSVAIPKLKSIVCPTITDNWKENSWIHTITTCIGAMGNSNSFIQNLNPFPTTIIVTPRAPPFDGIVELYNGSLIPSDEFSGSSHRYCNIFLPPCKPECLWKHFVRLLGSLL